VGNPLPITPNLPPPKRVFHQRQHYRFARWRLEYQVGRKGCGRSGG